MVKELVVVACHRNDFIGTIRAGVREHVTVDAVFVDTSGSVEYGADVAIDGGWPTGAYLWAIERYAAYDRFLFIQDSLVILTDPLPWFRDLWPGMGAAAWGRFRMQWDNEDQLRQVEQRYPDAQPSHGIFGPIFYTDRRSLDILKSNGLLPSVPSSRLESCASERAWAYAFATAGMPVAGPEWNAEPSTATAGWGPFRKVFGNRP